MTEKNIFKNQDITSCTEYKVSKGKLYGLKAYTKALKRFVSMVVWYPKDGRMDEWQLYFLWKKYKTHKMFCTSTGHVSNSNSVFVIPGNMPEQQSVRLQTSGNWHFT